MKVFRYTLKDDLLYPDEHGEVLVFTDGWQVTARIGDREITPRFHLSSGERLLLDRLKLLSKMTGVEVDPLPALAYPGKSRVLMLSKLMGAAFEEYVYLVLSSRFSVSRRPEIYTSLPKLSGRSSHNTPDLIVEGRVPVEAKVSFYNYQQILEYSIKYPVGALTLPFSEQCRVPPGWRCFTNLTKDRAPLLSWLDEVLLG
ncbi:hypothetical protein GWK48_08025 [Metallosphaera tengchongensis]|uniref:Uncharacterized protein n=1 Tax=Metallosphaera tengchongensis TaxID=1532350 RepID=A0A6N0NZ25_9CREN|nr:hypothetical protein [Metallosphaera tengchongensis]QKR00330.1 hypothetical protein GWK48_08025 [Metallosphaera tengchongensis]